MKFHIETRTLSAVSAENFNDVFSSQFENYRFIYSGTGDTGNNRIHFRLRVGGADDTSSNYISSRGIVGTSTGTFITSTTNLFTTIETTSSSDSLGVIADFLSPESAKKTIFCRFNIRENFDFSGGIFDLTTQFTGFSMIPQAGTLSGSASLYGYAKA